MAILAILSKVYASYIYIVFLGGMLHYSQTIVSRKTNFYGFWDVC